MLIIYQIKVVKFQKYFKTYLIKYNKLLIEFDLTASLKYEKYFIISNCFQINDLVCRKNKPMIEYI